MAAENLINLVTDRFNPDAIDALKTNLGIDIFSGQSASTADMTGSGWLCVAALNTIKDTSLSFDNDDIKSTLKNILDSEDSTGVTLKYQTNSKGDNILMQLLNYYINSTQVELSDILELMEYLYSDEGAILEMLKQTNTMGYSGAMIISYSEKYIDESADVFSKYASAFIDLPYTNNPNLLPIARLMIKAVSNNDLKQKALDAISNIVSKVLGSSEGAAYKDFNKIFFPFPYSTTEQADNSIIEYIYSIGSDLFKSDITSSDGVLMYVLSLTIKPVSNTLSVITNSIDVSKCVGIRYGETGFNLNSYKANAASYDPRIDASFHVVNKLGVSAPVSSVYNFFTPYLFPIPEGMPIEGYTLIGKISELVAIGDDNKTLIGNDALKLASGFLSAASDKASELAPDDALKKFFILNSILGTCRDFSDNATMNLYSPVNIILNTINKAHKAWTVANNATFDDYKDIYTSIVTELFGSDESIGFETAYKYWCNEYDKMF